MTEMHRSKVVSGQQRWNLVRESIRKQAVRTAKFRTPAQPKGEDQNHNLRQEERPEAQ